MKILVLLLILIDSCQVNSSQNCTYDFCHSMESFNPRPKNCFCSDCNAYDDCCQDVSEIKRSDSFINPNGCNIRLNQFLYTYSISKCNKILTRELNENEIAQCENSTSNMDLLNYVPVHSIQTN